MRHCRLLVAATASLLATAACTGTARPDESIVRSPPRESARQASSDTAERLAIPPPDVDAAGWIEFPQEFSASAHDLNRRDMRTVIGPDQSVVQTAFGWFVVDAQRGVVGVVDVPGTASFVGFDTQGMVAVVAGALWRTDDWAREDAWSKVATLPADAVVDVGPGGIVASDGRALFVSRDGGASFETMATPLETIDAAFVRRDGVLAVSGWGRGEVRASYTAAGRRGWKPADAERLVRLGGWIARHGDRTTAEVLAADGVHWLSRCWPVAQYKDWTYVSEWNERTTPVDMPTWSSLAPPNAAGECSDRTGGFGGLGFGGGDEPIVSTPDAAPPTTRHLDGLLGDGLCVGDADGDCADEVPPLRQPHAVHLDTVERRADVVTLPDPCDPVRLWSARGMSVLACRTQAGASLYTRTGGEWQAEGAVAHDLSDHGDVAAAPDGTVMLQGFCSVGDGCSGSMVRAPVAAGQSGAWRELRDRDALAYRVLDGGRVLRVTGSLTAGYTLSIVRDGRSSELATAHHPGYALADVRIRWADRSIQLAFRPTVVTRETRAGSQPPPGPVVMTLDVDGALAPSKSSAVVSGGQPARGTVLVARTGASEVVALEDLNGDGIAELAVVHRGPRPRVDVLFGGERLDNLDISAGVESGRGFSIVFGEESNIVPWSVVSAGDVNGDGLGDTVLTVASHDVKDHVNAYVVLGRKTLGSISVDSLERGDGGFAIRGGPEELWHGPRGAGVGDVDGDGLDDVALGFGNAHEGRGVAYVVYGKRDTEWVHVRDAERGIAGLVVRTKTPGARLGAALAGVGDLDGDGRDEFLVGAPGHHDDRGRVYGFVGAPRSRSRLAPVEEPSVSRTRFSIDGQSAGDGFGSEVYAGFDFDADGHRDVAIAAPHADAADIDTGRVYVVSGDRMQTPLDMSSLSGRSGFVVDGLFWGDRFGGRLGSVPSTSAQRGDTLLVAAVDARRFGVPGGLVYRVPAPKSGAAPRLLSVEHLEPFQRIGFVDSAGDLDGDGRPDIVVGYTNGPQGQAAAHVLQLRAP